MLTAPTPASLFSFTSITPSFTPPPFHLAPFPAPSSIAHLISSDRSTIHLFSPADDVCETNFCSSPKRARAKKKTNESVSCAGLSRCFASVLTSKCFSVGNVLKFSAVCFSLCVCGTARCLMSEVTARRGGGPSDPWQFSEGPRGPLLKRLKR